MDFPITISISASAVAWYAAIVSTAALIVQYLKYRSERINVRVIVKANYRVHNGGPQYPPNQDYVVVTVINKGIRPVTIGNVGFITKNKKDKNGLLTESVRGSRELAAGKSTDYLMEQDPAELEKIKHFVAYDKTGRKYIGKLKK